MNEEYQRKEFWDGLPKKKIIINLLRQYSSDKEWINELKKNDNLTRIKNEINNYANKK